MSANSRLIAAVVLVWCVACASGPARHLDGQGPVAWIGNPSGFTVGIQVSAYPLRDDFSFGAMILCQAGPEVATIISVEPTATIGEGFSYLGAMVRDARVPYGGVTSSVGFPPDGEDPEAYSPATGATIDVPCREPTEGLELVIGFERIGDSGGGWEGVDLHYSIDGREFVFEMHNLMLLCPVSKDCAEYVESVGA